MRTALLTVLALIAFAANSVLCRAALGGGAIDAASFSTIRLASGALTLSALVALRARASRKAATVPVPFLGGSLRAGVLLALYAIPFSFAYLGVTTGTGALLLFGAVQVTMLVGAFVRGERPGIADGIGLACAGGGLAYLVLPGLEAPPLAESAAMAVAGIGWGLYSLNGRGERRPLAATAGNFVRALPFAVVVSVASVAALDAFELTAHGALLACASGALASGVGYALWYAALPQLTSTRAALVQLTVPIIAAAGGVVFSDESVSKRLVIASVLILGGVALPILRASARQGRGGRVPAEGRR